MQKYLPSTSELKILITVEELNKDSLYPLPLGIYKILVGSEEQDYLQYQHLSTYSTLISYSSKHISKMIMMLIRYNYLEKIYDPRTNELYLKLSTKGELFLFEYRKKHKYNFKKRSEIDKPLIVKINK